MNLGPCDRAATKPAANKTQIQNAQRSHVGPRFLKHMGACHELNVRHIRSNSCELVFGGFHREPFVDGSSDDLGELCLCNRVFPAVLSQRGLVVDARVCPRTSVFVFEVTV